MTTWTKHDERQLQRAIDNRDFWAASLERSLNATTCREGERSRTERRSLIARADRDIAALLARKEAAKVAA